MNSGILLIVSLFLHVGREDEFRQFETEAARIMQKYGGNIERVIRPLPAGQSSSTPHEVHLISFPSMEKFDAYRRDPDLTNLASLRQSAIARTDLLIGEEGEPYL